MQHDSSLHVYLKQFFNSLCYAARYNKKNHQHIMPIQVRTSAKFIQYKHNPAQMQFYNMGSHFQKVQIACSTFCLGKTKVQSEAKLEAKDIFKPVHIQYRKISTNLIPSEKPEKIGNGKELLF
ncbi:hypothetical protein RYX36_026852 [Vicia faba]